MSAKSNLVYVARFRVAYLQKRIDGDLILYEWLDYLGRSLTYMSACEEAERLRGQYGDRHRFKVLHEKLIGKEKV
jgi:hypothetical protein